MLNLFRPYPRSLGTLDPDRGNSGKIHAVRSTGAAGAHVPGGGQANLTRCLASCCSWKYSRLATNIPHPSDLLIVAWVVWR